MPDSQLMFLIVCAFFFFEFLFIINWFYNRYKLRECRHELNKYIGRVERFVGAFRPSLERAVRQELGTFAESIHELYAEQVRQQQKCVETRSDHELSVSLVQLGDVIRERKTKFWEYVDLAVKFRILEKKPESYADMLPGL